MFATPDTATLNTSELVALLMAAHGLSRHEALWRLRALTGGVPQVDRETATGWRLIPQPETRGLWSTGVGYKSD